MALNNRQQAQVTALVAYGEGSRAVCEQFELTLSDYWNVDRRSPDNLAFFLNAAKRFPRIQSAMIRLIPMYAPVHIAIKKGAHVVTNMEGVSPKSMAKAKLAVTELIALKLNSLLHHPRIKVEIAFVWNGERQKAFKSTVSGLLGKGADPLDMLNIVTAATKPYMEAAEVVGQLAVALAEVKPEEPAAVTPAPRQRKPRKPRVVATAVTGAVEQTNPQPVTDATPEEIAEEVAKLEAHLNADAA